MYDLRLIGVNNCKPSYFNRTKNLIATMSNQVFGLHIKKII